MRILITVDPEIPVPPPTYGGIERIVNGLVNALQLRNHEIGLIAHPESKCEANAFYPWVGSKSQNRIDSWRNSCLLRQVTFAFRPDVVHSFSRILYMLPLLRSPFPKIMSYQREPTPRNVRLGAMLAKGSLSFTGCSEYICNNGRVGGGEWRAVHNFVDTDLYQFEPVARPEAPLVFLSRIERIKGAHTAIAVARRTGRKLIIAGNHAVSGPEFSYWKQEIEPVIGGDVEYIGPVDDVQKNELLGRAAAMIVPIEWNEPFGIVFAEALACGTPVISCPRGALTEIVRPGVEGFLIKTIDEACDAVRNLGRIDRGACRRRAEQAFSLSVIAPQYEQLYRERIVGS